MKESDSLATLITYGLIGLVVWSTQVAGEDMPTGHHQYDCGTLALHTLLAVEGRPTPLDVLTSKLPPPGPDGYSMKELRDTAESLGFPLLGVKLPPAPRTLDRCALVFQNERNHGHFLVIRPVGHSGRLIQVIDPAGDPVVIEGEDLYRTPGWTGLGLVASRTRWTPRILLVLAISFSLCVALLAAVQFRRRQRINKLNSKK